MCKPEVTSSRRAAGFTPGSTEGGTRLLTGIHRLDCTAWLPDSARLDGLMGSAGLDGATLAEPWPIERQKNARTREISHLHPVRPDYSSARKPNSHALSGASRHHSFSAVSDFSRPVTPEVAGSSPVAPVLCSSRFCSDDEDSEFRVLVLVNFCQIPRRMDRRHSATAARIPPKASLSFAGELVPSSRLASAPAEKPGK